MRGTTFKAFAVTMMADARTETSRRGRKEKEVERKNPELVGLFEAPALDATTDEAPAPEPENEPSYNPPTP